MAVDSGSRSYQQDEQAIRVQRENHANEDLLDSAFGSHPV